MAATERPATVRLWRTTKFTLLTLDTGPYGAFPGYPPMPGYPPANMKGYPPMPPMYPWPGYGQHPGHAYGQPQHDKDAKAEEPRSYPHAYPPYGFPGNSYTPQQPDKDGNAPDPRVQPHGYPPYGYGYPGMPPYPPPMSPSPSIPPPTPAPSAPAHPPAPTRFSSFSGAKRSASRRPDPTAATRNDAGHTRTYVKREPGIDKEPIAIEDYYDTPSNDLGAADDESQDADQEALDEIAEQERHIQMLRARLAKKNSRA